MEVDSDFFWLVGLLEGEGHFGISKSISTSGKRNYAVIRVEMTNQEVIERVKSIVKTGSIHFITPRKLHYKPSWAWYKHGKEATELMRAFYPHMSQYRRDQIDRVLVGISVPVGIGNYKHITRAMLKTT